MQVSLSQSVLARASKLLGRFGTWWLKEFLNLVPERYSGLVRGRSRPSLVIAGVGEKIRLELSDNMAAPQMAERLLVGNVWTEIEAFLQPHRLTRRDVDIGLRLPEEAVFGRELALPTEARDAIDAIVTQDLAKKTPFKAEDIYSDHIAREDAKSEKIVVRQWITRRQFVQQALAPFDIRVEDLTFIAFGDRQLAASIRLWRDVRARKSLSRRLVPVLCYSAVVLALVSGGLKYANQQATLDRLEAEISVANRKAQQVRMLVDQLRERRDALAGLRLQRSEAPGLVDVWEETTRILPLHSWLTELRLTEGAGKREQQVTMTGFSSAAPSLVGIIDGSRLFFDAALTSPVSFDATEGRERFALQAKVRSPDMLKDMAR
jgi:general secretion pathway protein L